MGRVEDNRKVLDIWKDVRVNGAKSFDEAECKLLAQQNAILADISRSLAVIADNSYSDFDKYFSKKGTINNIIRSGSDDREEKEYRKINNIIRSDSDDGEEKGL